MCFQSFCLNLLSVRKKAEEIVKEADEGRNQQNSKRIQHQELKAKTSLPKLGFQHGKSSDVPSVWKLASAILSSTDTKITEQPYFWQDS